MATLTELVTAIQDILKDNAYTETNIVSKINALVSRIAGGVRMPDGDVSPPLSDLFSYGKIDTSITLPCVSLPIDYQRNVFNVYDTSNCRINPPAGGNYYSFGLFLKQISNLALTEAGSIYRVCVKGNKIYYQGIPSVSTILGLHYYRKPIAMALDGDEPDGIPGHLAEDLIKHGVIKEIYGDIIEAGVTEPSHGAEYHTTKFYEAMTNLCDFIGNTDVVPKYYGSGDFMDAGICDG